jgi:hypothetical protein
VFLIVTRYVKNSYWYYESLKNEMEEVWIRHNISVFSNF